MNWNNKLWFVFLAVILMNGCEKKPITPDQNQKNERIAKETIQDEYSIEEDSIKTTNSEMIIYDFLSDFFQGKDFILLEKPLNVNTREIYFAVYYIMESPKIFTMAVGFEIKEGLFLPYLFIKDFKFIDKNDTVFIDFSSGYSGITGFNFQYSHPKVEGYSPGLIIETYFDNGKRIADSFTIQWNERLMTFEDIKPDNILWRPGL